MVQSINFVILGKQDLASEFGKKGTETDLTLYDRKESDIIKTWVIPNGFPEKIQSQTLVLPSQKETIYLVEYNGRRK